MANPRTVAWTALTLHAIRGVHELAPDQPLLFKAANGTHSTNWIA
ncbi:MAG: hypothetical protein U1D30_02385 [Planctomycetota bacterium]